MITKMQKYTGTRVDHVLTAHDNTRTVCNFPNQPLISFDPENLKEKVDYFKWLMSRVKADPRIVEFPKKNPNTQNMETLYALSHLVRVAGHFPSLDDAKCAIDRLVNSRPETIDLTEVHLSPSSHQYLFEKTSLPASETKSSSALPSNELQFRELLTSITLSWGTEEHLITIAHFFQHVFPRLRPTEPKSLPGLYRKYLESKGELVANASSVTVDVFGRNSHHKRTKTMPPPFGMSLVTELGNGNPQNRAMEPCSGYSPHLEFGQSYWQQQHELSVNAERNRQFELALCNYKDLAPIVQPQSLESNLNEQEVIRPAVLPDNQQRVQCISPDVQMPNRRKWYQSQSFVQQASRKQQNDVNRRPTEGIGKAQPSKKDTKVITRAEQKKRKVDKAEARRKNWDDLDLLKKRKAEAKLLKKFKEDEDNIVRCKIAGKLLTYKKEMDRTGRSPLTLIQPGWSVKTPRRWEEAVCHMLNFCFLPSKDAADWIDLSSIVWVAKTGLAQNMMKWKAAVHRDTVIHMPHIDSAQLLIYVMDAFLGATQQFKNCSFSKKKGSKYICEISKDVKIRVDEVNVLTHVIFNMEIVELLCKLVQTTISEENIQ